MLKSIWLLIQIKTGWLFRAAITAIVLHRCGNNNLCGSQYLVDFGRTKTKLKRKKKKKTRQHSGALNFFITVMPASF